MVFKFELKKVSFFLFSTLLLILFTSNSIALPLSFNVSNIGIEWLELSFNESIGSPDPREYTPYDYSVVVGTYISGNMSSTNDMLGNDLLIDEVAGVPGFDIRFNITTEKEHPKYVIARWRYNGGAGHESSWEIYDYNSSTWKSIRKFSDDSLIYNSMTMILPDVLVGNYVNDNNIMQIRAYHPDSGNNAHEIFIDYVGVKY